MAKCLLLATAVAAAQVITYIKKHPEPETIQILGVTVAGPSTTVGDGAVTV